MAIVAVFDVSGMTSAQYEQTINDLENAGLGNPDGRIHHVAASTEDGWFVADIWESGEQLEKFSESLIPILQRAGVTPAEPKIYQVHNTIIG